MRNIPLETLSRVASVAVPVLLFLTLAAWAFASTVGSSPDDNFHLASIWCGWGLREGLCEDSGDPATRLVPAALIDASCYMFDSSVSGACWEPGVSGMDEATWLNSQSLYPPVFYATMSIFASPDVQTSVLAMRLANALFGVAFVSTVFFALPRFARPALLVSFLATTVPLGLFLLASTNPSSWALISAGTVWICTYGALRAEGRRQILLCVLSVAGVLLGAGARADAATFAVFGIALGWLLGAQRGRPYLFPGIAAAISVVTCVILFLSASQGDSATAGLGINEETLSLSGHIANLLGIPGLWYGVFGSVALGWLDTSMPQLVPVLAFGAFCASVAIGVRMVGRRRGIALALATAALWITPFVLLARSNVDVADYFIQPRYILPLMILLLGVASLAPRAEYEWSASRVVIVGSALTIAGSLALHVNMRRYTTGADQPAIDPGSDAEWWWTGVPAPMVIWILSSASFALVFALLALVQGRALAQPKSIEPPDSPRPGNPDSESAWSSVEWMTTERKRPGSETPA